MGRANLANVPDFCRHAVGAQSVNTSPAGADGEVSIGSVSVGKRGGARNRADRRSKGLTNQQIANLCEGSEVATDIGLPLNRFITIDWEVAGIPLGGMAKATTHFIDLLTKWLSCRSCRTAWIRVHENARSTGGHCHMIVHVPPEFVGQLVHAQKRWLRIITGNPYRSQIIKSKPIGGRLRVETSNPEMYRMNLKRVVHYICKGSLDHELPDWQPGGLVIGKRCGTSQNIGLKARTK